MSFTNIEIKARTGRAREIRRYLQNKGAVFKGLDNQTDTYFNAPFGRLKLRQGNIENALIFYDRADKFGPKQSDFTLVPVTDGNAMSDLLTRSLGVKVVVRKQREIYYMDNVKFHIDSLASLGEFVEIEASNMYGHSSLEMLQQQCAFYIQQFDIKQQDFIDVSYSDMLLAQSEHNN